MLLLIAAQDHKQVSVQVCHAVADSLTGRWLLGSARLAGSIMIMLVLISGGSGARICAAAAAAAQLIKQPTTTTVC